MAKLFIGYPAAPELRQENGLNAVLVDAADVAAAKAAAIAAKVNGSTDNGKVNAWTFAEIAATAGTLPGSVSVLWLDGAHGVGASGRTF